MRSGAVTSSYQASGSDRCIDKVRLIREETLGVSLPPSHLNIHGLIRLLDSIRIAHCCMVFKRLNRDGLDGAVE